MRGGSGHLRGFSRSLLVNLLDIKYNGFFRSLLEEPACVQEWVCAITLTHAPPLMKTFFSCVSVESGDNPVLYCPIFDNAWLRGRQAVPVHGRNERRKRVEVLLIQEKKIRWDQYCVCKSLDCLSHSIPLSICIESYYGCLETLRDN